MPKDLMATVAYDGDALAEGSMDVRELAPALLGFGDLLQEANATLNEGRAALAVHVQSDFKEGSFEISLGLMLTASQGVAGFFGQQHLSTAKQIAEYVGLVTGAPTNLIGLLKKLKGHTPTNVTTMSNGDVSITLNVTGDNNRIVVPGPVYRIAQNPKVQKAYAETLRPLQAEGIDKFETRENGKPVEVVRKEDLPLLSPVPSHTGFESRDARPRETLVQIIKPSFDSKLKWRLSDGSGGKFNALMKDATFNERVDGGQSFAKGDVLRVELRSTPHVNPDGSLRTDHEIVRVVDKFNRPRQTPLLPDPE